MSKRELSSEEYDQILMYAADKYGYLDNYEHWLKSIYLFVEAYKEGGKFVVYNDRNQYLSDFDVLDDALCYIEENEPKNEMWKIEVEKCCIT